MPTQRCRATVRGRRNCAAWLTQINSTKLCPPQLTSRGDGIPPIPRKPLLEPRLPPKPGFPPDPGQAKLRVRTVIAGFRLTAATLALVGVSLNACSRGAGDNPVRPEQGITQDIEAARARGSATLPPGECLVQQPVNREPGALAGPGCPVFSADRQCSSNDSSRTKYLAYKPASHNAKAHPRPTGGGGRDRIHPQPSCARLRARSAKIRLRWPDQ